jgi:predicted HNH restriction endonuclease
MSSHARQHPEDYRPNFAYRPLTDAERDARTEDMAEIAAQFWRCVTCDLTFDGAELVEDGFDRDIYGAICCPNCHRTFDYDQRTKKQPKP